MYQNLGVSKFNSIDGSLIWRKDPGFLVYREEQYGPSYNVYIGKPDLSDQQNTFFDDFESYQAGTLGEPNWGNYIVGREYNCRDNDAEIAQNPVSGGQGFRIYQHAGSDGCNQSVDFLKYQNFTDFTLSIKVMKTVDTRDKCCGSPSIHIPLANGEGTFYFSINWCYYAEGIYYWIYPNYREHLAGPVTGTTPEKFLSTWYTLDISMIGNEITLIYDKGTPQERVFTATHEMAGLVKEKVVLNQGSCNSKQIESFFDDFRITIHDDPSHNNDPTVNLGDDYSVLIVENCEVLTTLDGSGASDPDGDPMEYTWTGPFGEIKGGNPVVTLPIGIHTITLTVIDGKGGQASDNLIITITDETPPVPDIETLAELVGACGVDVTEIPTASDNCSGVIPGTTGDPLSYDTEGTFTITWMYDDGNGNISEQTQQVVISDEIPPVPNTPELSTITGECSLEITKIPTATDNCVGSLTGVASGKTSFNIATDGEGSHTITWIYDDGNGNITQQPQTVVLDDITTPVPEVVNLPDVTGQCSAMIPTPPTATDNCAGTLTGVASGKTSFNIAIDGEGPHTITWVYDDGNGNITQQPQTVVLDDITAPVPEVVNLPDVIGQCSATILAPPTATDNCAGSLTGMTNDPMTYTAQGDFVVTWTFDDGNGNITTQTQVVGVHDVTAPVFIDDLDDITKVATGSYGAKVIVPLPGVEDNCDNNPIVTSDAPADNIYPLGTTTVTFTATDYAGNSATATIMVTVSDDVSPVITISDVTDGADYTDVATAAITIIDNESGVKTQSITLDGNAYVSGTAITTKGNHILIITATDYNNNTTTVTVNFSIYHATTLSVSAPAGQYSDMSALSAVLNSHGSPVAGKSITFSVNDTEVGIAVTSSEGIAVLNYTIPHSAGTYEVSAVFTQDNTSFYRLSDAVAQLAVTPEDASILYTGNLLVPYPNTVSFVAVVTQADDGFLGDLTKTSVLFNVSLVNSDGTLTTIGDFTAQCNTFGLAQTVQSFDVGVYSITISIQNDGYYTPNSDHAITPVYDPNGGFATGGGWVNVTNPEEGDLGRANFGFIAKYKNNSSTGNLEFQYHDGGINLKSQSIDWLVISSVSAQFEGVGTIKHLPGTYTFRVNCTDNKKNGKPDKFTIKIWEGTDTDGDPVYKALNQELAGGNVLVKKK